MINLKAKTIPHHEQRYDSCGDYDKRGKIYEYKISDLGNEYEELCVLIHELIESFLAKKRGISWDEITEFDLAWENDMVHRGKCHCDIEPGNCCHSPYKKEHNFATKVEKMIAKEYGIDWNRYDKKINNLQWKRSKKQ